MTEVLRVVCPSCGDESPGFECRVCCDTVVALAPGERERIAREWVTERLREVRYGSFHRSMSGADILLILFPERFGTKPRSAALFPAPEKGVSND